MWTKNHSRNWKKNHKSQTRTNRWTGLQFSANISHYISWRKCCVQIQWLHHLKAEFVGRLRHWSVQKAVQIWRLLPLRRTNASSFFSRSEGWVWCRGDCSKKLSFPNYVKIKKKKVIKVMLLCVYVNSRVSTLAEVMTE